MSFLREMYTRVLSKTPLFFRKIRAVGLVLTTICGPVAAIPTTYTGAILSDTLIKMCSYGLVAGVVMASVATLTKTDTDTKTT